MPVVKVTVYPAARREAPGTTGIQTSTASRSLPAPASSRPSAEAPRTQTFHVGDRSARRRVLSSWRLSAARTGASADGPSVSTGAPRGGAARSARAGAQPVIVGRQDHGRLEHGEVDGRGRENPLLELARLAIVVRIPPVRTWAEAVRIGVLLVA